MGVPRASGACCRCNREGLCKGCLCIRAGHPCSGCLPGRLGQCWNPAPTSVPPTIPVPVSTISDIKRAVPPIGASPTLASSFPLSTCCQTPEPTTRTQSSPSLPPFEPSADPSFTWGALSGIECARLISKCYDEAIYWKANLFKNSKRKGWW